MLEWGHMVECLNKVDAGVSEQLLLLSRDEGSMLVVTYADVARCLSAAYQACPHRPLFCFSADCCRNAGASERRWKLCSFVQSQ